MKTFHGGCHCGAVRYEADMEEIGEVMDCNCSHCSKKGFLLKFLPASLFRIVKGEGATSEYRFNKKHIAHLFCATCGVQTHGHGSDPDGTGMVAINTRTFDEGVPEGTAVKKVNGKDL